MTSFALLNVFPFLEIDDRRNMRLLNKHFCEKLTSKFTLTNPFITGHHELFERLDIKLENSMMMSYFIDVQKALERFTNVGCLRLENFHYELDVGFLSKCRELKLIGDKRVEEMIYKIVGSDVFRGRIRDTSKLASCRKLSCCDFMILSLTGLTSLEELNLEYSDNLDRLSSAGDFRGIHHLTCDGDKNVTDLNMFTCKMSVIDCSGCDKLTNDSIRFTRPQTFVCHSCKFTDLNCLYENLTELDCFNCSELTDSSIRELGPRLKKLSCNSCNFTDLNFLTTCEELECR
jgi:hypothetical protein